MSPPDPLAPIPLFPFPLYSSVIAGFEAHRDPLVREILQHRQSNPGIVRSNRNAWHSGDEWGRIRSEHVAWVLSKAMKFARLALAPYYDNWATQELTLGSAWANVLGPGGWNAPHHHYPCHWSGVYYVSTGPVGRVPGDPAGMIEFLSPTPWLSVFGQGGNFLYGPKDGLTLLWPSGLYHFVHPHQADEVRISIAFNYNVVPKAPARAG